MLAERANLIWIKLSALLCGTAVLMTAAAPYSGSGMTQLAHPSGVGQNEKRFLGHDHDEAYAPVKVDCPSDTTWIRPADSLSKEEQDYLLNRRPQLEENWKTRIRNVGLKDPPRLPVVAMALSGAGYRAMISGSGMAFQSNDTAGSVGDILDVSSYIAGLSGGSWALSSWISGGGKSPHVLAKEVWDLSANLVVPFDLSKVSDALGQIVDLVSFYDDLHDKVKKKKEQGFETQITDYWALALSNHLFPNEYHTDKSPNLRWSDMAKKVKSADVPWPIILAVEREPGEYILGENSTIYEFSLTEFGSWSWGSKKKVQGAFTPLRNLGTTLNNGKPKDGNGKCVEGFDNAGFVAGTSSSLFNGGLMKLMKHKNLTELGAGWNSDNRALTDKFVEVAYAVLSSSGDHVATYPNPFYNWNWQENPVSTYKDLTLVDGGMAGENIPIDPFLQRERKVDAIFAFDNSADDHNWPSGEALYTTYEKSLNQSRINGIPETMPPIPPRQAFINAGLNTRPVYFGCNDSSMPTIIYVPNYPWSTQSNYSTFKLEYSLGDTLALIDNGRRSLDLNGTEPDWSRCLTCAMMENAVLQNGSALDDKCEFCLNKWCWDGKSDVTPGKTTNNVAHSLPIFLSPTAS